MPAPQELPASCLLYASRGLTAVGGHPGLSRSVRSMASEIDTSDPCLDEALLTVELELMRNPAMARLNGARRRETSMNILIALNGQGLVKGVPSLQGRGNLRAA